MVLTYPLMQRGSFDMKIPRFFLRKRTARFAQLAQRDDIRVVGPLAEALRSWDREAQEIAEAALIRLLPRLRAEHDVLLTPDQRKTLNRALRGRNELLALAILKALKHIGDSAESLTCVTRMVYERSRSGIDSQSARGGNRVVTRSARAR